MASTTFTRRDLKPEGFFGRLFGSNKANALIELNNALAKAASVRDVRLETIDALNRKYRIEIDRKFHSQLAEMYHAFLRACLADRTFTQEEIDDIWHLKALFGISDIEHEKMYEVEALAAYATDLRAALKDSKFTEQEKSALERLSAYLRIPESLRRATFDGIAKAVVQQKATEITADNQLSPQEEAEFLTLCRSLGVDPAIKTSNVDLDQMRLLWRLNNAPLQPLAVHLHLQRDEECYHCVNVNWYEPRRITRRISYGGPSLRIKIMKGVYWNTGSYGVQRHTEDVLTHIDSGTLYLTNKRVLFDGAVKNNTIRLSKILDITPYSDGIGIEKDTGKSPILMIDDKGAVLVCTALLARLIRQFA